MIYKGEISFIGGSVDAEGNPTQARATYDGIDSCVIVIPWWLRGTLGNLAPGTPVAFALFEDNTGVILARMDGEGGREVPWSLTVNGDISTGVVTSLDNHTHGGVETGTNRTSGPQ